MRWWHIAYTVGVFFVVLLHYVPETPRSEPDCCALHVVKVEQACVEIAEVLLICRDCRRSVSCSCYSFAQEEVCSAGWPSLSGVQLNTVKPQQELGENLGLGFFLLASII